MDGMRIAVADSDRHFYGDLSGSDLVGDRMRSARSGYGEASERQQERALRI
jgi:hypothetical protein